VRRIDQACTGIARNGSDLLLRSCSRTSQGRRMMDIDPVILALVMMGATNVLGIVVSSLLLVRK